MRSAIVFFLLLLSANFLYSQSDREWGIEMRFKTGFLAAHRGVMGHLADHHAFAGEISWFNQTKGCKQWHSACSYPTVGGTLFGGSVGNNEILGTYWGGVWLHRISFYKAKALRI